MKNLKLIQAEVTREVRERLLEAQEEGFIIPAIVFKVISEVEEMYEKIT